MKFLLVIMCALSFFVGCVTTETRLKACSRSCKSGVDEYQEEDFLCKCK